jgi:hypothetical protein
MPPMAGVTLWVRPRDASALAGRYRLVGHYGEVTTFSVRLELGELLQTFAADDTEFGPYWFVHVYEADEKARAA